MADKKKPASAPAVTPAPAPVVNKALEAWEPNPPAHPLPDPPHPYPINVVPAPAPFSESAERKPAFLGPPTHERVDRLTALIEQGNPAAVMVGELGTWHETQASNADGSWKVREFIWPNTPGALAALRELGLHE